MSQLGGRIELLDSSEQSPELLLYIVKCKRAIPQQRIIAFKLSIVPKVRSPALCIKIERVD